MLAALPAAPQAARPRTGGRRPFVATRHRRFGIECSVCLTQQRLRGGCICIYSVPSARSAPPGPSQQVLRQGQSPAAGIGCAKRQCCTLPGGQLGWPGAETCAAAMPGPTGAARRRHAGHCCPAFVAVAVRLLLALPLTPLGALHSRLWCKWAYHWAHRCAPSSAPKCPRSAATRGSMRTLPQKLQKYLECWLTSIFLICFLREAP